jgi:rhodanese-related sulfurtransferase
MEKSFSERVAEAKAAVPTITPEAAKARRDTDPDILFIDPREAADILASTGLIPGALNFPLKRLMESTDDALPEALASRSRPIIAACQAGPMGALTAHALQKRGFTNVAFMDGGTQGWLNAGYPTQR